MDNGDTFTTLFRARRALLDALIIRQQDDRLSSSLLTLSLAPLAAELIDVSQLPVPDRSTPVG